jgi:hypothetical protein
MRRDSNLKDIQQKVLGVELKENSTEKQTTPSEVQVQIPVNTAPEQLTSNPQ